MQTLKIPIKIEKQEEIELIRKYQKQYTNLFHLFYNLILDKGLTENQSKHCKFNNLELMDAWFTLSCYKEASQLVKTTEKRKVIFGGKKNFFNLMNRLISKEEWKECRLKQIYSIGDKNRSGNRKFKIVDENNVVFKPNRNTKINITLKLNSKSWKKIIKKIISLQELNEEPITYRLDTNYIYISFEESCLKEEEYKFIKNRVMAIDMNPNYIGYSVVDWKSEDEYKIIDKGVFSIKQLNDKERKEEDNTNVTYFSNKRNFEIFEISKKLIKISKSYKCEMFGIEKLDIENKDSGKGRRFNRLINNQWNRSIFYENVKKRCNIVGIKFIEVKAEYSSFIGNIIYRNEKLPDMILSSIEIGRRAYEFNLQYILKEKSLKKNIIFPEVSNKLNKNIQQSLEELKIVFDWKNLKELYNFLKNTKCKYRISFESSKVFSNFRYLHVKY